MAGEVVLQSEQVQRFFKELKKNYSDVKNASNEWIKAISATVIRDIDSHFQQEEGPDGRWAQWSKMYRDHMEKIGKGGNKILQDKRDLYRAFKPSSYRSVSDGVLWYNNAKTKGGFPYAAHHDEDAKVTRPFMWLSDAATERVAEITAAFFIR